MQSTALRLIDDGIHPRDVDDELSLNEQRRIFRVKESQVARDGILHSRWRADIRRRATRPSPAAAQNEEKKHAYQIERNQ